MFEDFNDYNGKNSAEFSKLITFKQNCTRDNEESQHVSEFVFKLNALNYWKIHNLSFIFYPRKSRTILNDNGRCLSTIGR